MTAAKFSLNFNWTLFLSVLLHLGFFLIGLFFSAPQTSPLPIGMELRYHEAGAPVAKPAVHRPKSFLSNAKNNEEAVKPQEPTPTTTGSAVGTQAGTSATGALSGREGIANGSEISPEERYLYELQKLLEHRKNYPVMAKKMGQTGTVTMRFTVTADGSISESEIVSKSPYASLNQAALALVQSIHKLKPFPPEIQKLSWSMTIPIRYELN